MSETHCTVKRKRGVNTKVYTYTSDVSVEGGPVHHNILEIVAPEYSMILRTLRIRGTVQLRIQDFPDTGAFQRPPGSANAVRSRYITHFMTQVVLSCGIMRTLACI